MQAMDGVIRMMLDGRTSVPWAEIQRLLLDVTHGCRVPDANDYSFLHMMVQNMINSKVLSQPRMPLAPVPQYTVPPDCTLSGVKVRVVAPLRKCVCSIDEAISCITRQISKCGPDYIELLWLRKRACRQISLKISPWSVILC